MKKLLRNKKRALIGLGVIIVAASTTFFLLREPVVPEEADPSKTYYSQLTGLEVSSEEASQPILGIMIGNSEEARPQTGLSSAGIVFESVTEGGITRYLALYQEDQPDTVGPVRSIRTHYLDWLMGFEGSIAHVGGSAEALELVDSRETRSLNQFEYDNPYYRDNNRVAPHNTYVRTTDLRDLQKELEHNTSTIADFRRSDDSPAPTPDASAIGIDFSAPVFSAEFRYDQASNSYIRFLAGEPHIDTATNQPIRVKNLVVLITSISGSSVQATGSGDALVFKDGTVQKMTWKKESFSAGIQLTNSDGQKASLNRGNTWIAAVGNNAAVTY